MKVWASASAIGLSLAYFAVGCSSEPPTDNGYVNPGGGTSSTAGTGTSTSGTATGGTGTGGSGTMAGTGSGGDTGTSGSSTAGSETGGTGGGSGGAPPAGACPDGVQGHCKADFEYPKHDGYTLQLVEEFDAPLDLNNDPIWTWSDGSPESGQTGFREQNIGFADGHMTLTAEHGACAPKTTNPGCIPPRMSFGEAQAPATQANVGAMGVWSGELRSKYNNYRYGRYEVKFAAPLANPNGRTTNSTSGFLSTMFVFRTPKNQIWNEIDIELEPKGFDKIFGNAVNFTGPGGIVGYPNDAGRNEAWEATGPANYNMYDQHEYAFNWTPGKIEWFVDGQLLKTFTGEPANVVSSASAKIMLNLWIFSGNAFGDSGGNVYPFTAKYDWFRFYKYNAEEFYPCSPTPGCLPDPDKTTSSQNNPKEQNYGK